MKIDRSVTFIKRATEKHNNKYDYSKVEYKNAHAKVCIICPEHGEFWITPNSHLNGHGCPQCSGNKKENTKTFIERSKKIHGEKYDYSKVEYVNMHTKVIVICPYHGEFLVSPANHLRERGCPKCKSRKNLIEKYKPVNTKNDKLTLESFIEKGKEIHGNKYDYSKVNFKTNKDKICIICPIHGEFWQRVDGHLNGKGCTKCGREKLAETRITDFEEWLKCAKKIHGDKYDYSKTIYKNTNSKLCIICPEHGEFWQVPTSHLAKKGCPKCAQSHLENEVEMFLKKNNINYISQHNFVWLTYNKKMHLDFYLPDYNIAIECQGLQHFEPIEHFGGLKKFKHQLERDIKKRELCEEHGIKILYYSKYKKENMITEVESLKKYLA